jgi:hypothetical protein
MRHPRLGLRRQGVNFAIVIPGRASARTMVRNCVPYETDVHIDNTRTISKREVEYAPTVGLLVAELALPFCIAFLAQPLAATRPRSMFLLIHCQN